MRRSVEFVTTVLLFAAMPALCADMVTLAGKVVRVTTDRYEMAFECGSLVALKNKLTGETYSVSLGDLEARLPHIIQGLTVYPTNASAQLREQIDAAHPWLSGAAGRWSFVHHPSSRSEVALKKISPSRFVATWTGLQAYNPDTFLLEETYALDLEIMPGSGDLSVKVTGNGFGPGTLGAGFLMANFSADLDFIWPVCEGAHGRPREWDFAALSAKWPSPWLASLVIAEGRKGCVGMWMADPQMRARWLHLRRNDASADVVFESVNSAPFVGWDHAESRPVRLNVYAGRWPLAAKAFRSWWASAFDVKPLAQRQPAWLRDIRWAVHWPYAPPKEYGPRTVFFAPQCWKVGPAEKPGVDGGLFPEDMAPGPQLSPGMAAVLPKIFDAGSHPIVYLNINLMNRGHPLAARYFDYRIAPALGMQAWQNPGDPPKPGESGAYALHCAARPWQDLIVGWARQTCDKFGISGFYMDCAAGEPDGRFGLVNGKNDCQGQTELMGRLKREIPGCFLDCEYLNEVTATRADFGSVGFDSFWPGSAPARQKKVHPIVGCLFNDYAWVGYISPEGKFPAFDETVGRLPRWSARLPLAEGSVTGFCELEDFQTFRAQLWCRTLMRPVYPDTWEPQVHAYYEDGAGSSYVVLGENPDEGKFVKRLPKGREELVYWRLKSRTAAPLTAATGLPGWVAYDGANAIGLDPEKTYLYTAQPRYRQWEVSRLPEQCAITKSRPYPNGLLVLDVRSLDGQARTGMVEVATEETLVKVITVSGATVPESLPSAPDGRRRYRFQAVTPGVIACLAREPQALQIADAAKPLFKLADAVPDWYANLTAQGIREPIPAAIKPSLWPERGYLRVMPAWQADGVADYVWQLPGIPEGKRLIFRCRTMLNAGWNCTFRVRVNGQDVLKADVVNSQEGQDQVVDLTPWAGKAVLFSLLLENCTLFGPLHFVNGAVRVE